MANSFIRNPMILDTQNDDANYTVANDFAVAGTGLKYNTRTYEIAKIKITGGANTNQVVLKTLPPPITAGTALAGLGWNFWSHKLETGALEWSENFIPPLQVTGILPLTITSGVNVYIYYR